MDLNLTQSQKMIQQMVRTFAQNEVAPGAAERDTTGEFPWEVVKKMAQYNLLGIPFPRKYEGSGADTLSYIIAVEELSRVCATTGVIVSAHTSLGSHPIYQFGTEEQKELFLIPLARGEKLGGFGLTEPNAGTDAGSLQTTAIRQKDYYRLNGSKIFITNGGIADTYVVFAKTSPERGTKNIAAFIVEKGTPGFSFGKKEDKMGIRASSTTELIFNDCQIPVENLLGQEGEGFKIAMQTLDGGRIGIAAQALGIAQACLDASVRYAKEREQFGKPIGSLQAIQWMLADMATQIKAARFLTYQAAWYKDQKRPFSTEAAMAKLFASETAMQQSIKAVQIHGGYGYIKDYPVERFMRDAKITELYEGTSEVQRLVIAANLLK
ncbi:acyl-CoA dehydrogenase [Desulfosporosinus orientis DSM 765]|uniref:Acyl-CoA dehydrogenase n=1 Tax=Desulfosporosinus orientis (strain ATCC 19365 / DSM 765 / NCIMB 8382 / VKM B-1628 / Singapore I) TaxID=768706 RepID=G7WIB7_DESOD|nr:acyl-CoA dehydrogenase [Desulfosporosinus orientis]AET68565.1 acyl-CoA dehydrogenase [Desulfosporosinus orientis DSM 765]